MTVKWNEFLESIRNQSIVVKPEPRPGSSDSNSEQPPVQETPQNNGIHCCSFIDRKLGVKWSWLVSCLIIIMGWRA